MKTVLLMLVVTLLSFSSTLVVSAQTPLKIPEFRRSTQVFRGSINTWGAALKDLDGDGDMDMVLAAISEPSRVLINDGKGYFAESDQLLPNEMHDVAIGDIDGDGDQDLFFAPNQNQVRPLFLNDGQGKFEQTALVVDVCGSITLIDIENDGDLDAYLGMRSELLINEGRGGFTRRSLSVPSFSASCDLTGDGFVDFIGAISELETRRFVIFLNDRIGGFREFSSIPTGNYDYSYFTFADLDNDRDIDVLYANSSEPDEGHSGVLVNDGTGRFSSGKSDLPPATAVGQIKTGDLNGDGFLDLVITNWFNPAQVWLNDGRGGFSDSGIRLGEGRGWANCLVADMDNDTDLDLFIVNRLKGNHGLWVNQVEERNRK